MDGYWYEAGDSIAREKIGQALRELNHEKYKSSMTAKRQRWRKERVTAGNDEGKLEDLGLNQCIPRAVDIVCGKRGNANARRPGNRQFSQLIRETLPEYTSEKSRIHRTIVVASIVSMLRSDGIKFVKFDPKTKVCLELTSEQAHQKVCHAIRDQIKQCQVKGSSAFSNSVKQHRRHSDPIPPSHIQAMEVPDGWSNLLNGSRCFHPSTRKMSWPATFVSSVDIPAFYRPREGPTRRTSIEDVQFDLSNMIWDMGQSIEKLEANDDCSDLTSVTSLEQEDQGTTRQPAKFKPIQALSPLSSNDHDAFEAKDMEVVCDILANKEAEAGTT